MGLSVKMRGLALGCRQCAALQGRPLLVALKPRNVMLQPYSMYFPGLFGSSEPLARRKEYSERRLLGYSMDQMYDIVVDVEKYVKFVPWCKGSTLCRTQKNSFEAKITVGFPPLEESYISLVSHARPHLVKSVATQGKLFNHLVTVWRFRPGLADNPQTCILDFSVSFEFRSLLHSHFAGLFFDQVVLMMVSSFLKRARALHGPESIQSQRPKILAYDK